MMCNRSFIIDDIKEYIYNESLYVHGHHQIVVVIFFQFAHVGGVFERLLPTVADIDDKLRVF